MYRILSVIVVLFSLLGGGYAVFNLFTTFFATPNPVSTDEAKGFAAAFTQAYLTYEEGKPQSIRMYTDLPDNRGLGSKVAEGVSKEEIYQRVIEVWPVKTEILAGKHMNVRLMAVVKRVGAAGFQGDPEKNTLVTYQIDVPVTEGEQGKYKILQYPKMVRVDKSEMAKLPVMGSEDSRASVQIKPMLESYFRTYFTAEKKEDIANFYKDTLMIPEPQKGLFLFEGIQNIMAFGEQKTGWFVLVSLNVRDPYTTIAYSFSYALKVVEEEGKYYIISID